MAALTLAVDRGQLEFQDLVAGQLPAGQACVVGFPGKVDGPEYVAQGVVVGTGPAALELGGELAEELPDEPAQVVLRHALGGPADGRDDAGVDGLLFVVQVKLGLVEADLSALGMDAH